MANFEKAYNKVIKTEGFYANDPDDRGGETYMGVARKFHPNSKIWPIIDNVTKSFDITSTKFKTNSSYRRNIQIQINNKLRQYPELHNYIMPLYKTEYWDKANLDNLNSQLIATQIFDHGVNAGMSNAIKIAQGRVGLPRTGRYSKELLDKLNNYGKRYYS